MVLKQYSEHEHIPADGMEKAFAELLQTQIRSSQPTQDLRLLRLLGMDFDWRTSRFVLSYYVGTDWIDRKKGLGMMALPKIEHLDFQTMFMTCFENREVSRDLDKLFFIRTEDEPIAIPADSYQLEPLLLVFFMNLVQRIVRKGLKHDYILREERLDAQIKGKLIMSRYVKHGLAQHRPDKTECRFQEYHADCLENRIIKSALLLCRSIITRHETALGRHLLPLQQMYSGAIAAFADVSSDVTLQDLHRVHVNPVYKDYKEAMPLAKMIIRHRGHLVGSAQHRHVQLVPPFIIDMPILFERYVYCLLAQRYGTRTIGYQEGCGDSRMDFTKKDEGMILDTKYVASWGHRIDHDHARQLSGYGRRTALRDRYLQPVLGDSLPALVVIYPDREGISSFKDAPDKWLNADGSPAFAALQQVGEYERFYKLAVRLPMKGASE